MRLDQRRRWGRGAGGDRPQPSKRLGRVVAAVPRDAHGVLAIEVEAGSCQAEHEADPGRPGGVDQVGDHVVHRPPVAEGRHLPLLVAEGLEVAHQSCALGVHDGPDVDVHDWILESAGPDDRLCTPVRRRTLVSS